MKEFMITSTIENDLTETVTIHKHIGGGAYIAIFAGNRSEVTKFMNENNITEYGYGY